VRALQDLLPVPHLEAGIDKFIFMMPERYLERPLWDDVLGRADHAGETGHRLMRAMHRSLRALSLAGMNVIADHVLVEPGWVQDCAGQLFDLPAYLVGVRCPLEVLEGRERSRRNRTLGQARLQHALVHAHGVYDLEVDTAQLTPQECAGRVQEFLAGAPAPQAWRRLKEAGTGQAAGDA
jgi:chloramphenicol 3-O phosphotransferase